MKKVIYVPQGYCAKISKTNNESGDGLYTDNFSNCNIIICEDEKTISLFHFDGINHPNSILEQANWTPNSKIIIIHREDCYIIKNRILFHLKGKKETIVIPLKPHHINIAISFSTLGNIYPGIEANSEVKNITHHPHEDKLLTVRKISQMIGIRSRKAGTIKCNNFLLFNGEEWTSFTHELQLDTSCYLVREELSHFDDKQILSELCANSLALLEYYESINIKFAKPHTRFVDGIVCYLERYLNNYNYKFIFKRNMEQFFTRDNSCFGEQSQEDIAVTREIKNILQKKEISPLDLMDILYSYKMNAPETKYKQQLLAEFIIYKSHYDEQDKYEMMKSA